MSGTGCTNGKPSKTGWMWYTCTAPPDNLACGRTRHAVQMVCSAKHASGGCPLRLSTRVYACMNQSPLRRRSLCVHLTPACLCDWLRHLTGCGCPQISSCVLRAHIRLRRCTCCLVPSLTEEWGACTVGRTTRRHIGLPGALSRLRTPRPSATRTQALVSPWRPCSLAGSASRWAFRQVFQHTTMRCRRLTDASRADHARSRGTQREVIPLPSCSRASCWPG